MEQSLWGHIGNVETQVQSLNGLCRLTWDLLIYPSSQVCSKNKIEKRRNVYYTEFLERKAR